MAKTNIVVAARPSLIDAIFRVFLERYSKNSAIKLTVIGISSIITG